MAKCMSISLYLAVSLSADPSDLFIFLLNNTNEPSRAEPSRKIRPERHSPAIILQFINVPSEQKPEKKQQNR